MQSPLRLFAGALLGTTMLASAASAAIIDNNAGTTLIGSPNPGIYEYTVDASGFENLRLSFDFDGMTGQDTEACMAQLALRFFAGWRTHVDPLASPPDRATEIHQAVPRRSRAAKAPSEKPGIGNTERHPRSSMQAGATGPGSIWNSGCLLNNRSTTVQFSSVSRVQVA